MNKTKLKYVKYTKQELDRYVRDKNSCISLVNSEMHVGFPPWGFANFQETLTNIISRDKIGKYDSKMDGIVLDIRNIKVFGTAYQVHNDDAVNHINIKANFYIFQPRIGVIIKGIVKHISHGHVAVIIYRVFNVSIRFNYAQTRETLSINQQIEFCIKKFDLHGAMPYIEGELIKVIEPVQPKKTVESVRKHIKFDGEANDSGNSTGETSGNDKRKVKKIAADSEDSDDSDSSNERLANELFPNVKVKEEKFSDSEEERKYKSASGASNAARRSQSSSDSDSSDDDEEENTKQSFALKKIKQEKDLSAQSSSDSDSSSSDAEQSTSKPLLKNIKKEKKSSESSSESDDSTSMPALISRKVKSEPVEENSPFKKPLNNSLNVAKRGESAEKTRKRKRTSSMSDQIDSLVNDVLNRSGTSNGSQAKSKKSNAYRSELSFGDLSTAGFQSPALSSTLKPNSSKTKSKTKNLADKMNAEIDSPQILTKLKQEPQSEDESTRKKKQKRSKKASEGDASNQSLKSLENSLYDSFLK